MAILFEKGAKALGEEFLSGNGIKVTGKLFGATDIYRLLFDKDTRKKVRTFTDLPLLPDESEPERPFQNEEEVAEYVMKQLGLVCDNALKNSLKELIDSFNECTKQSDDYVESIQQETSFRTVIALSHLQSLMSSMNLLAGHFINICEILEDPEKSPADRVQKLNAIFQSIEDRTKALAESTPPNKALVCLKVVAYMLAGLALVPLIPLLGMAAGGRIGTLDGRENEQNIAVTTGKAIAGGLIGGLVGTVGMLAGLCAVLISPKYLFDHQVQGQKHAKAIATAFLPATQRLILFGKTMAENTSVSLDEAEQTQAASRSPRQVA